MNRNPYQSYRGRKNAGRNILVGVVIALAVALVLALIAMVVLPNYVTYTADGARFDLPFFDKGRAEVTPEPMDSQEPQVIVDGAAPPAAGASAAPGGGVGAGTSPAVSAAPGDVVSAAPVSAAPLSVDLSGLTRREAPLGLSVTPGAGQGGIVDQTIGLADPGQVPTIDRDASRATCQGMPYAAAWLAPDWNALLTREGGADDLTRWCLTLADGGYDEILFSEAVPTDNGAALAQTYQSVKAALAWAGWQGRLGLVLDQGLTGSEYDPSLLPAIAQSFERLYFRSALQSGVQNALTAQGFNGQSANIVTVYAGAVPGNVRWAWAVLPQ